MDNQDPVILDNQDPKVTEPVVDDWRTSIPEEIRVHPSLAKFQTPGDLGKSYIELEKLVGKEKIPMPKKDVNGNYDQKELDVVYDRLGRPKDATGYILPKDFKLPEGMNINENFLKEFNVKAHKAGMLPQHYDFTMRELASIINQGAQAKKEADEKLFNETTNTLKEKWGLAYQEKQKTANGVLKSFVDPALQDKIIQKYGNDPLILEWAANVGANLNEESITKVGMTNSMLTPESAREQIVSIKADKNHPLNIANHPEHKYWVKQMDVLYAMAGN